MADFCVGNFVGEWDSLENLIDGADGVQSLSLATDSVERILTLTKSQNVAIYNKK